LWLLVLRLLVRLPLRAAACGFSPDRKPPDADP
jgi:hypothetical protein